MLAFLFRHVRSKRTFTGDGHGRNRRTRVDRQRSVTGIRRDDVVRLLFQSGTLFDAAKSDLQWAISVQSLRFTAAGRARLRVLFGPPAPLSSPASFSLFDDVDAPSAQQRAPSDAFDSARSAIFDAKTCGVALDATLPSPSPPARTNLARRAEEFAHETSTRVVRSYLHPADLPSSSGPTDERRVPASTSRRASSDPRDFPPDVSR